MANSQDLIQKVTQYVEEYMSHFDGSHDFSHIKRVVNLSHEIHNQLTTLTNGHINKQPLDLETITLSALLHDVGDNKYLEPDQQAETLVLDLLVSFGASPALAQKVQTICLGVSYTSEIKDLQKVQNLVKEFPELAVVQDADRLDAIGAVGIGRVFTYGGAKTNRGMDDTMGFLREEGKLLKLEGMMKTVPGRQMARERTERLLEFSKWWDEETKA
jgi:uncharacterized protein